MVSAVTVVNIVFTVWSIDVLEMLVWEVCASASVMLVSVGCAEGWVVDMWLGTVSGWVDVCCVLAAVVYDVHDDVVLFGEVVEGIEKNLCCCLGIV